MLHHERASVCRRILFCQRFLDGSIFEPDSLYIKLGTQAPLCFPGEMVPRTALVHWFCGSRKGGTGWLHPQGTVHLVAVKKALVGTNTCLGCTNEVKNATLTRPGWYLFSRE